MSRYAYTTDSVKNPIVLAGSSFQINVEAFTGVHPNKVPFRGILTQVDVPSDRPPNGSDGHRVLIPRAVAQQALPTLAGMGVNISPLLDNHAKQNKIGVITDYGIEEKNLWVSGHLYGKDFAREVEAIKAQSRSGLLGMSFEISDVAIEDADAEIWTVVSLIFTGASILRRDSAAYGNTSIAASRKRGASQRRPIAMATKELMEKNTETIQTLAQLNMQLGGLEASGDAEADEAEAGKKKGMEQEEQDSTMSDDADAMKKSVGDLRQRNLKKGMDTEKDEDAESDEDAGDDVAAMGYDHLGGMDLDTMGKMFAMMLRGGMKGMLPHGDMMQDVELFKTLMKSMGMYAASEANGNGKTAKGDNVGRMLQRMMEAAQQHQLHQTITKLQRAVKEMQAAQQLMITDTLPRMAKLLTDVAKSEKSSRLATDQEERAGSPGGGAKRKTIAARGEDKPDHKEFAASYKSKYGIDVSNGITEGELDSALRNLNMDTQERLALKITLEQKGLLTR